MTTEQVQRLQRALNEFTQRNRLGFKPLIADGSWGPATEARIKEVKYDLGFSRANQTPAVSAGLYERMLRPTRVDPSIGATKAAIANGRKRRVARRAAVLRNRIKAVRATGVSHFDGVAVAKGFIPYLEWARENGWTGTLQSGWRDPVYSEGLCKRMCGAPSCPGRCAGRSSRHSQTTVALGAVDVSDYARFGQLMGKCPLTPKLVNHLGAADPVHFSVAGN